MFIVIVGNEKAENAEEVFKDAALRISEGGQTPLNIFNLVRDPESRKFCDVLLNKMQDADAIFLLDGWAESKLAQIALRYAEANKLMVYDDKYRIWTDKPDFAPSPYRTPSEDHLDPEEAEQEGGTK